jgi:hypothetical protein
LNTNPFLILIPSGIVLQEVVQVGIAAVKTSDIMSLGVEGHYLQVR